MLNNVMTTKEAALKYNIKTTSLTADIRAGRGFKLNVDANFSEGTWLITQDAMERNYGVDNKIKIRDAKKTDRYKLIVNNLEECELNKYNQKIFNNLGNINLILREYTNYYKKKNIDDLQIRYLEKGNLCHTRFNYKNKIVIFDILHDPYKNITVYWVCE